MNRARYHHVSGAKVVTGKGSSSHKKLIDASWSRCNKYGLTHNSQPTFGALSTIGIGALLDEHYALLNTTQKEVLPYYENILSHSNCLMLLADRKGHVLHTWGEQRSSHGQLHQLAVGSQWTEESTGTNAIGTAIAVGEAVQVGREEHFLRANRYMVGSASPIFNTQKEMVGVLDISSDAYLPQDHTLGLVKLITLSVENRLIYNTFSQQHLLVSFNTNAASLSSPWSGLVALDDRGRIVSANRRAEIMLARGLAMTDIESIFDCKLRELRRHPKGIPLSTMAFGKYRMHLQVHSPTSPPMIASEFSPPEEQTSKSQAERFNAGSDAASRLSLPDDVVPLHELDHGDERVARLVEQATRIMEKEIPILLHGETGSGKEVFVRSLHYHSGRRDFPLVAVNCAAIPSELVESELFGYEKGAFTGASNKGSIGLIRKAHEGTLFLDEIGEMPMNVQARLLRVLQERSVNPLGSTESYPVDIKLVSATNRNLKQEIESGRFRGDLFYRISGLNLELPALRVRRDKRALIKYVHRRQIQDMGEQYLPLNETILDKLVDHPWPGNVRQLINVLGVALAMADGEPISSWHLPDCFFEDLVHSEPVPSTQESAPPLRSQSSEAQAPLSEPTNIASKIALLYQEYEGNVSRTAKAAGVSRNTVYKYIRDLKA